MSWSGTVYCSNCYEQGHNKRGCPKMKEFIEANPDSYDARMYKARAEKAKIRRCSYCSEQGHNRRSCGVLKGHHAHALEAQEVWSNRVHAWMIEQGLGIGALVSYADGSYNEQEKVGIIKTLYPQRALFLAHNDSWKGDFIYVTPLGDERDHHGRFLRPSVDCPGFYDNKQWGGTSRIKSVVSPISGSLVEGHVEKLTTPQNQIYEMFQGHMNANANASRTVAQSVLDYRAESLEK